MPELRNYFGVHNVSTTYHYENKIKVVLNWPWNEHNAQSTQVRFMWAFPHCGTFVVLSHSCIIMSLVVSSGSQTLCGSNPNHVGGEAIVALNVCHPLSVSNNHLSGIRRMQDRQVGFLTVTCALESKSSRLSGRQRIRWTVRALNLTFWMFLSFSDKIDVLKPLWGCKSTNN